MSEWREVKLEAVIKFVDGDRGKNYPKQNEYLNKGYCVFLNTSNITKDGFNFKKVNYIDENKDKILRNGRLDYGDLILTTRGTIGNVALYQTGMYYPMRINSSMLILKVNESISNNYLYYVFKTDSMKEYMTLFSSGSAQPQLPVKDLKKIKFKIPEMKYQEKVANVLSTYDELIENNNRRIEVLEQTAEEIYKEWFVRMRFPGYENTKFVKGIPEGWEVKRVKDLGEVVTGKTPSTKVTEYYGEEVMFVKTPDMHGNIFTSQTESNLSEAGSNSQDNKLLPQDSIMVSCIGTGGVVSINMFPAHTNQQINSIILEDTNIREWAFLTLKPMKQTIELFGATGATMTNLSKGKFEGLKLLYPSDVLLNKFNNITKPMFEELKSIILTNENLKKQRDLLLPRLMNGSIKVK